MSLITQLSDKLGSAFEAEGLEKSYGRVIVSDRPDLAQFQCNGALAAAKAAKKNPCSRLRRLLPVSRMMQAFPRWKLQALVFINLTVTDGYLGAFLTDGLKDTRCAVPVVASPEIIMLDYGGPNVAKPMHVGHLRSSIIGDFIRRILKFAGYNTVGDIHMGDWGTQMGMMISELEILHPDWVYFDPHYAGEYPAELPVTMEDLEEIYPRVSALCKTDEARLELSKRATVYLQNKRRGYYALWKHFVAISLHSMKKNFSALNVHFDLWKGETDVHDLIAPMVADLEKRGYAVKSEGATVVHVKRNDDDSNIRRLSCIKKRWRGFVWYSRYGDIG